MSTEPQPKEVLTPRRRSAKKNAPRFRILRDLRGFMVCAICHNKPNSRPAGRRQHARPGCQVSPRWGKSCETNPIWARAIWRTSTVPTRTCNASDAGRARTKQSQFPARSDGSGLSRVRVAIGPVVQTNPICRQRYRTLLPPESLTSFDRLDRMRPLCRPQKGLKDRIWCLALARNHNEMPARTVCRRLLASRSRIWWDGSPSVAFSRDL